LLLETPVDLLNLFVESVFQTVQLITPFFKFGAQISNLQVCLIQFVRVEVEFFLQLCLLLLRVIKLLCNLADLALGFTLSQLKISLLARDFILLVGNLSSRLKKFVGQVRDDLLLVLVLGLEKLP